ncbi:MAG: ABC transporter ATP-binding protein [Bacillus sp. (in: firmicutes)]
MSIANLTENNHVLNIKNLSTEINTPDGITTIIEDINLSIDKGEIMAIVGESGSGKSMTIQSILQLLPSGLIHQYNGSVKKEGTELFSLNERELRDLRGKEISLVAQNAMTSLDPSYKVGSQIIEIIMAKTNLSKKQAKKRACELFEQLGIDDPMRIYQSYPHQLSGGLRQRVVIAMSVACEPDILIADEPTSALDPTIQKQVLDLFKKINKELGTTILMITHDFGVVAYLAQKVAVMYAGQIVEKGRTEEVIFQPKHPYTKSLLKCIPNLEWIFDDTKEKEPLWQIDGEVPKLSEIQTGCRFANRCSVANDRCKFTKPLLKKWDADHYVRCILTEGAE